MSDRQSRVRLLPYYLYASTLATAFLPAGAMWLTIVRNGEMARAVQLAFVVAAVHLLVVAGLLVVNWRGMIRQLRGISRVQIRRWPWCRLMCRFVYRDTDAWWKSVAMLVFVPEGLILLMVAYVVA